MANTEGAEVHYLHAMEQAEEKLEKLEGLKTGGGGGNSGGMDVPYKDYLDARLNEAKAQGDAKFAEVLTAVHGLRADLATKATMWTVWGAVGTGVAAIFGVGLSVLAFGGDRFDAGMGAASVDGALVRRIEAAIDQSDQSNDRLNARMDQVIRLISAPPAVDTQPEN